MALLAVGAASLVALQASNAGLTQARLPTELAGVIATLPAGPYVDDLALALGATSDAVREREAAVAAARTALARAVAGLAVVAEASPALEFERDLADPADQGAWTTDLDVSVAATYRRDSQAVARARLALTVAEARLRDQLRDDLQRVMLALSARRLAERSLEDAVAEAAAAAAAVGAAVSADASEQELLALRVAAELAANAVERERAAAVAAWQDTARLGLAAVVPSASMLLDGADRPLDVLAPTAVTSGLVRVPTPEQHVRARTLAQELALAVTQSSATPFAVVREIEVYGAYENTGFEVEGRVALVTGVPLVGSTLSWTNGADDVGFVVGVGATLRLTDTTASAAAAAALAVSAAQSAYAGFLDAQVGEELAARRAAELEFEDFVLSRLQLMNAEGQLSDGTAAAASERELQRLSAAVRRAHDATERAWQRYVRSLVSYLGVVDAAWRADVMEER